MTNELIETFLTVANVSNISKAATFLYVSQATVSYRLKQLEKELGGHLINRNKGSKLTSLTPLGKRFLPLAQSWIHLNHEIDTFQEQAPYLELTIGLVNSANNYLFLDLYRQLKQDRFDWRLNIKTLHTQQIYDQASLNLIDIGFPLGERIIPDITVRQLHTEKLMIVSQHKLTDKPQLQPCDLQLENQIYIDWGADYRHWHNEFFPAHSTPKFAVDSAKVAFGLLEENAWFFAPYSMCMHLWQMHGCYISQLATELPERTLYMITNRLTESNKRKELILFQRRLLHFIRHQERCINSMLDKFQPQK